MYIHPCVSTDKVLAMLQNLQTQGPQFARSINDRLAASRRWHFVPGAAVIVTPLGTARYRSCCK